VDEIVGRHLTEDIQILEDEVVFCDNTHRVAVFKEHFQAFSGNSESPL
jgi:hypothetical protein|tara:strand:+ start:1433 stop:1576 length:144 start_codon:yes stop_codon:yes gene_type:complete